MLFSLPSKQHWFTAETLAPTGTPNFVTPSCTELAHKTLRPTPEPPLHESHCRMWAHMTVSVIAGPLVPLRYMPFCKPRHVTALGALS